MVVCSVYLLGLDAENVSVKKLMNSCVSILKRSSKKKTINNDRVMKRFLLSLTITLCSVFSWAQSSVVQMGEAVVRCNDFAFAKTMLLNEGLSVVKSSKRNDANTIVLSNGSESIYSILYVCNPYPELALNVSSKNERYSC